MLNKLIEEPSEHQIKHVKASLLWLYYEFVRRSILWATHLDKKWNPRMDYVKIISPEISVKNADVKVLQDLQNLTFLDKKYLEILLKWYELINDNNVKLPDLPHLYEPLARFYQRGGSLEFFGSNIDIYTRGKVSRFVGRVSLRREVYEQVIPLLDLSDKVLDDIDDKKIHPQTDKVIL